MGSKKMKNIFTVDLESTCFNKKEPNSIPNDFFSEIIEIGANLLNTKTFEISNEMSIFVKPTLFPILSPYCIDLTTITQEMVDNSLLLQESFHLIHEAFNPVTMAFASWGDYDNNQFGRSCKKFNLIHPLGEHHINLRKEHAKHYANNPSFRKIKMRDPKKGIGMQRALKEFHHFPLEGTHHRGVDDARNISKIAIQMIKDGWKHPYLD
jgi:3'-5' exoribonuclease 1